MRELDVAGSDGRVLRVAEAGVADGWPVLVLYGSPCSRLIYDGDARSAERLGIRLVSFDRPGYGGSSRREGRSVADCVDDVRAIAETLGIERLAVWGISGGGPHSLACAALGGELVAAAGVLGSIAPWGADGLDYFEGMGEMNVEDIKLYFDDPVASREKGERDREEMLAMDDVQAAVEYFRSLLAPVDAAAMTSEYGEWLFANFQEALRPGLDGWWDDGVAHMAPWGFDLAAITTPVFIMHGRHDRFVPFAHGRWLADHVPGAEVMLSEEDGHLTLQARHLDRLHSWLLERL